MLVRTAARTILDAFAAFEPCVAVHATAWIISVADFSVLSYPPQFAFDKLEHILVNTFVLNFFVEYVVFSFADFCQPAETDGVEDFYVFLEAAEFFSCEF